METFILIFSWLVFVALSGLLSYRLCSEVFFSARLPKIFRADEADKKGLFSRPAWKTFLILALMVVLSRAVIFLWSYLTALAVPGMHSGASDIFFRIWDNWDSKNYLSIAEKGYRPDPGQEWLCSFPPLFPLSVRVFHAFIPSYFLAALLFSHLCLIVGTWFFYKLVALDYTEDVAFRSVKYLLIFPFSFFLNIAFSEGLFFMLLVCTCYLFRREKYAWAGLLSILALWARVPAVQILLIFFCAEYIAGERIRGYWQKKNWRGVKDDLFQRGKFLLLLGLGEFSYLLYNKLARGNWFAYYADQKKYWSHHLVLPPVNLQTMFNTMNGNEPLMNLSLWGTQIVLFFVVAGLLAAGMRWLRLSHVIFFYVYFFSIYSVYWLLSAGRYLIAALPLYIILALLGRNRTVDFVLTLLSIMFLAFYVLAYTRALWVI